MTIVLFHDPEPGLFARQIAALKRRYSIVSLQSYLDWRAGNASRRLPAKSLIVTFDDGHKGNAALLETLRSEGVPATIFLCSGVVGTRRRFWFQHGLPDGEVQKLKLVPDDSRVRTLEHHGFSAEAEFEGRQALSHAEVRSLEPHVDFQAHTVTHPILPNCSSEKAEAEIGHSKKQLEGLGSPSTRSRIRTATTRRATPRRSSEPATPAASRSTPGTTPARPTCSAYDELASMTRPRRPS